LCLSPLPWQPFFPCQSEESIANMQVTLASTWGVWVPDTVDARLFHYYYDLAVKQNEDSKPK
jgi:hypothetical protein